MSKFLLCFLYDYRAFFFLQMMDLWFPSHADFFTRLEEGLEEEDTAKLYRADKIPRSAPAADTNRWVKVETLIIYNNLFFASYPVSWVAVKQWFIRMPKQDTENLGVQNIENGPVNLGEESATDHVVHIWCP